MLITLQQELKKLRKEKGLTQQQVAMQLNMSRSSYAYKELDGSFSEEELNEVANILGTTYGYLSGLDRNLEDQLIVVKNADELILQTCMRMEAMMKALMAAAAKVIAANSDRKEEEVLRELEVYANSELANRTGEM